MHDHDQQLAFDRTIGPVGVEVRLPRDPARDDVATWFRSKTNMELLFSTALRQSIDEVLDGQRTGRFNISQLEKTEKTYLGTKVEIVLRATFEIDSGGQKEMDYKVAGHPVDSKFTSRKTWTIPAEAVSHICLLTKADDVTSTFSAGLIRIREEILNLGRNNDGKTTISKSDWGEIDWLCLDAQLPSNLIQTLPTSDVEVIMRGKSGQQRINELLRRAQGMVIDRTTSTTVARQLDGMKRCRDARPKLRPEGIVVLGHLKQGPIVARDLNLPPFEKGEFIAVRLTELEGPDPTRPTTIINGRHYAIAKPFEPAIVAPDIVQS
ncbi:NaeI family type II restriction endonuclease [Nocardia sp. NPDC058519]|uniref:NaeI family type II restriction endonuclease n=1 Tax=Nocardia sp. NPDC058519 TaxID=3346535 RepID=UPI0036677BD2